MDALHDIVVPILTCSKPWFPEARSVTARALLHSLITAFTSMRKHYISRVVDFSPGGAIDRFHGDFRLDTHPPTYPPRRAQSSARRRRRRLHERPLRWEALRMWREGVMAQPPSEQALRLTWRAWCWRGVGRYRKCYVWWRRPAIRSLRGTRNITNLTLVFQKIGQTNDRVKLARLPTHLDLHKLRFVEHIYDL